jgi:hypothetical protein
MEKTKNQVHEKFCNDIEFAADALLGEKEKMFDRKFQLYRDKEWRLNFIGEEIEKTKEKIKNGIDMELPPRANLDSDFEKSLSIAFKRVIRYPASITNKIEFNDKLKNDVVVFAPNKTLSISPNFHFYNLEESHKLINHVADIWYLKELEDLENEIIHENNNLTTGFDCNLHPDTVKEIYYFLAEKFIKGDLQDFQAIFSNSSNTVKKPIQWLITGERGKYKDRGNQTALNEFLKLMLGKISAPNRRKAKDLFIDENGYFIKKSLLKPDKTKILTYGFETGMKEILK